MSELVDTYDLQNTSDLVSMRLARRHELERYWLLDDMFYIGAVEDVSIDKHMKNCNDGDIMKIHTLVVGLYESRRWNTGTIEVF